MKRLFSAALVLLCCNHLSADLRFYHQGVIQGQKGPPIVVKNDMLQPFSVSVPGRPLFVNQQTGIFIRGVTLNMDDFTISLDAPVPVGDIQPSLFTVGNFRGLWGRGTQFEVYDIPFEIVTASFGPDPNAGIDNFFLELATTDLVVDEIFDGIPFQLRGEVSINNATVPEPSQWAMFGLLAIGVVAWRQRR